MPLLGGRRTEKGFSYLLLKLRITEMEVTTEVIRPSLPRLLQGPSFICLLNSENRELVTLI